MITLTPDDRLSLKEIADTLDGFRDMFINTSVTFKRLDNDTRFLRELSKREETVCTKTQ